MIRVLHIFHQMANGGVEHFVMNFYRNIERAVPLAILIYGLRDMVVQNI